MDFYEALNKRRSIRGYKPDAVPEDAIRRIGEAVRTAPTACNRQPCQILLVRNPEKRAALAKVYPQKWLAQAPIIAVLVGCESEAWKRLEGNTIIDVDAAIVMEHFMLAATAEGLGTCWICAFLRAEKPIRRSGLTRSIRRSPCLRSDMPPRNPVRSSENRWTNFSKWWTDHVEDRIFR